MRINGDTITFSTGKEIYAHGGIIGISNPDEFGWPVSEGYDGGIDTDKLSLEEKIELSNYMIDIWEQFKQAEFLRFWIKINKKQTN